MRRRFWLLVFICCVLSPVVLAGLPQPPRLLPFTPAIRKESTWTEWIGQWTSALLRWRIRDPPIHQALRHRSEQRKKILRQREAAERANGNTLNVMDGEIVNLEIESVEVAEEDRELTGDTAPTSIHGPLPSIQVRSIAASPTSTSRQWLRAFIPTKNQKKTMQALTRELDFHGRAPLHAAAMENDIEAVDDLLEWIDVDFRDSREATALHYAAQRGHIDLVAVLLKQGANLEAVDSQGWTPLWYAIQSKNHDLVQLLLLRKPTALHARLPKSESMPIHYAATLCLPEIIGSLLKDGADPLAQDAVGNNVFMMFAAVGCVEGGLVFVVSPHSLLSAFSHSVTRLLSCPSICFPVHSSLSIFQPIFPPTPYTGATPILSATPKLQRHSLLNHQNQDHASALHFAAYFGQSAILSWLLPRSRFRQDFQGLYPHDYASLMGHQELAETLYTSYIRKSLPSREELLEWRPLSEPTYLMDAVERDNIWDARVLLDEMNANVNAALCGSHMTALHLAMKRGGFFMARELLHRGADVDAVLLPEKETPLHLAIHSQRSYLVRLVLDEGARVDPQDRHGYTPLARTIVNRDLTLFLILLDAGASTSITVENGSTMLMLAALANAENIALHLLSLPLVDANTFNRNRETALSLAIVHRHTNMVKLLLEKATLDSLDLFDRHSITPLASAVAGRQLEMVRLLLGAGAKQSYRGGHEYPLHLALKAGYDEIAVTLLDQGNAPVNELSIDGETPLYLAIKNRACIEIIRKLMHSGADPRAHVPPKLSALELAKAMGNVPLMIIRQLESTVRMDPGIRAIVDELFEKPQKCSICLNTISKGKGAYVSRCQHPFHQDCVHQWEKRQVELKQDKTCPLPDSSRSRDTAAAHGCASAVAAAHGGSAHPCRQALSSLAVL